jgi:hypothetical protein
MDIRQVREKYPQYNHVSDEVLANKLHEKYYSHVPKESFYSKIGFKPESKGFSGVAEDAWQGVKDVVPGIINFAQEYPSELVGATKQVWTDPVRAAQNIGQGVTNFAEGVQNFYPNSRDYLRRKEITKQESPDIYNQIEHADIGKLTGRGKQKPGDALISNLVEMIPSLFGGELGQAAGLLRTGQRAGSQALNAIGQNENPVTAAVTAGALEGAGKLGGKAISKGYDIASNPITKAKISEKVVDTTNQLKSEFTERYHGNKEAVSQAGVDTVVPEKIINSETFSQMLKENRVSNKPQIIPSLSKEFYYDAIKKGLKPKHMVSFKEYLKNPTFENARGLRSDLGKAIKEMNKSPSLSDAQLKSLRAATKAKEKLDLNIDRTLRKSSNPALADELKSIDTDYSQYKPLLENKNINAYIDKVNKFKRSKGKGNIKPAQKKLVKSLNNDTEFQASFGKEFPGIGINQMLPDIRKALLGGSLPIGH